MRVVQAYFKDDARFRPHPATVARAAQPFSGPSARPPHPATVAPTIQPFFKADARPPHPATVGRAGQRAAVASPKSASFKSASLESAAPPGAAQLSPDSHAFQTPPGFLEGQAQSPGQELPPPVQRKMEAFFGADFSDVRVHVGSEAPAIGALAFTIGSDLYFAPGQYEPHSSRGQELIGHELAHVMQQRAGRVANPFGSGVAVVQDPALEDEANRLGKEVAAQRSMPVSALPPHPALARATPGFGAAQKASPASPAQAKPARIQAKPARTGYEIVVGAYMHEGADSLPEELAGHSFVALRTPDGEEKAFGFSPARFSSYDPKDDLPRLRAGVTGVIHDDAAALEKPGVKTRSYAISPSQAQAAMAKVSEYQSGKYQFSLRSRQCATFAEDVLRAASIAVPKSAVPRKPREVVASLADESTPFPGRSR